MKKKSQIGIFILVALIIVVALVYLISGDIEEKTQTTSNQKNLVMANPNIEDLYLIQDSLNYCLERETRRAIIIAGFRGGFIYDNQGYYSNSVMIENTYNENFITNLNLNWNNLFYQTLVYSQSFLFSPFPPEEKNMRGFRVDSDEIFYFDNSVKEDFERFILEGVISCMQLDKFEEMGFNISYEKFSGKITAIEDERVIKSNLQAKLNDIIEISVGSNLIRGKIIEVNQDNEVRIEINQNDFQHLSSNIELDSLEVINLNSTMDVEVSFLDESIKSKFFFPLKIISNDYQTSITTSQIEINVRFKKLMEFAHLILNNKNQNRDINIYNESEIYNLLKDNNYVQNGGLEGIELYVSYLNDSEIYRKVIFSFVDSNSIIYGNKFVFNFGYENHAPKIDLNNIAGGIEIEEDLSESGIMLMVGKNQPFHFDLKKITSDTQLIDNYRSYFIEQSILNSDSRFELTAQGNLSFTAFLEKAYSFEIQVSDGELTRTQNFIFITGFPSNENNLDALDCFVFIPNNGNFDFPVDNFFKNSFNYNFNGDTIPYAFALKSQSINTATIEFSRSCMGTNPQMFDIKYTINDGPAQNLPQNGRINVPLENSKSSIKVNIRDQNGNNMIIRDFEYHIFPANCLGPFPSYLSDLYKHLDLSWSGSCCDVEPILESIENGDPSPFLNSVIGGNQVAIDADFYACLDERYTNLDVEENILWEINEQITSVFDGNIHSSCKGTYPNPLSFNNINHIKHISSPSYSSNTKSIILDDNENNIFVPFSFSTHIQTQECEFCNLENGFMYLKDSNEIGFKLDLKEVPREVEPGISSLSSSESNLFIKCSNDIYGSIDQAETWEKLISLSSFLELPTAQIYSSYGFCQVGNTQCLGRIGSPNYQTQSDNQNTCTNWQFVPENIDLIQIGATWQCSNIPVQTSCNENWTYDQEDEQWSCNIEPVYSYPFCTGVIGESCPSIEYNPGDCECLNPPEEN